MSTTLQSEVVSAATMSASSDLSIAAFKRASRLKSAWQIVNSVLPLCALWYVMYLSLDWSYWLTLLLAIPTSTTWKAGFRITTLRRVTIPCLNFGRQ
jgi:fatty acid desaturase